jgi:hypothetical protein
LDIVGWLEARVDANVPLLDKFIDHAFSVKERSVMVAYLKMLTRTDVTIGTVGLGSKWDRWLQKYAPKRPIHGSDRRYCQYHIDKASLNQLHGQCLQRCPGREQVCDQHSGVLVGNQVVGYRRHSSRGP